MSSLGYNYLTLVINGALIVLFIGFQTDALCSLTLLTWINIFLYSLRDLGNRGMLFAYNVAFFTFLLGREFLEQFFGYEVEVFSKEVWSYTDFMLLISVLTYGGSYFLFKKMNLKVISVKRIFTAPNPKYVRMVRRLSSILFWIVLCGAIIYATIFAIVVATVGYIESYQPENSDFFRESLIMRMLNRSEMILPIALCSFYATMPPRKECNKITLGYLGYLFLTLFGGHRGLCVLGLLLLFVYYYYRNRYSIDGVWIKKKWVVSGCCVLPLFLILLTAMNDLRTGSDISFSSATDGLTNFVYQQGVSGIVIKRAYENEKTLKSESFYSLHFLNEGVFSLLNDESYPSGNSVEKAQSKKWMQHTLPYILWEKWYLAGQGTGSSYIAELNQDFGLIGVILGNMLYGFLLSKLSFFSRRYIFTTAVKLIMIMQLLWAPRGGFTEFVSVFFNPSTIAAFAFIYVGSALICHRSIRYIFNH